MKASSTFPAVGTTQCCCGVSNGTWRTWHLHDGTVGKTHSHSSRSDAFDCHWANIETLKHTAKEGGI
jgi:hypothetical protein